MMRVFKRSCIRNNIPVAVSQGFSPHLRLSFGLPLSVGMSSSCEYMDMLLTEQMEPETVKDLLQKGLASGIRLEDACQISSDELSLSIMLNRAVYKATIPQDRMSDIENRIKDFKDPFISMLELRDNELFMDLPVGQEKNIKPVSVIRRLTPELNEDELKLCHIHRERLYHERNTD